MTRYQHLHFLLCHLLFQCDEDMPDFSSHDGACRGQKSTSAGAGGRCEHLQRPEEHISWSWRQ
ncbi:hypothetical protein LEMLEM_LOCUS6069, partial [Lemmus lemmus]